MKKLITLLLALSVTFIMVACEPEVIIETRTEVVEVDRIIIEEHLVQLTPEQIENNRVIMEYRITTEVTNRLEAELRDTVSGLEEQLATAIDELEPIYIYEDVIVVEKVYIDKVEYINTTSTVYVDVPGETIYVYENVPGEIVYQDVIVEVENTEVIDFLMASLLDMADWANDLQVHVGLAKTRVYDSYQEYFNAIAVQYTKLVDELDDANGLNYATELRYQELESEIVGLENILVDDEKPVLGEVTFTTDENDYLVLTVNASDNRGLKSLEVDHNIIGLPEFTVGTDNVSASQETYGASSTFDNGIWTINFGQQVSSFMRNNSSVTFYFVIKDLVNNQFGNMYYVSGNPDMVKTFNVPPVA